MKSKPTVDSAIVELLESYHDFNGSQVEIVEGAPSALKFLRYVHKNRPVVFKGAVREWAAVKKWDATYLREKLGETKLNIAHTPHGNADSVVFKEDEGCDYFVKPFQEQESFASFLDYLLASSKDPDALSDGPKDVKYAQSQDDNLHGEFSPLAPDVAEDITWATEALEQRPDAVNVWIGNDLSVSAMHKDNYENIYCQVVGQKEFVLISPLESICVVEKTLPVATYSPVDNAGSFQIVPDEPRASVPCWPTEDPDCPGSSNSWWRHCRPLRVLLNPGDVLYLPAMWYHKVSQQCSEEGLCCAVNYWYDMDFSGPFYSCMSFVRNLSLLVDRASDGQV